MRKQMMKNQKKRNAKKKLIKKKLRSPYPPASLFDYKNVDRLKEFVSEKGKIAPRKISGLHAKDQRRLARVVKQARHAGLLPFVHE